jgi:hypothetical protein
MLKAFVSAIEGGLTRQEAAKLTGFNLGLHISHVRKGVPAALADEREIERAEATAVARHLQTLNIASQEGSIRAAEIALRMLRPAAFSQRVDINVSAGVPTAIADEDLDAKERLFYLAVKLLTEEPQYLRRIEDMFGMVRTKAPQLPQTVDGKFDDDEP